MDHKQALLAGEPGEDWDLSPASVTVGIHIFDVEHREMLDHLHSLYDGLAEGRSERHMRKAMAKLCVVAQKHFDHEEEYMRTLDYADYRQHAEHHLVLGASLTAFMDELFADGASAERNLANVREFFRNWLLDHILEYDRSFANFLAQKGIR